MQVLAIPTASIPLFHPTFSPFFLSSGFGEKGEIDQTGGNFRQIDFVRSKQKSEREGFDLVKASSQYSALIHSAEKVRVMRMQISTKVTPLF